MLRHQFVAFFQIAILDLIQNVIHNQLAGVAFIDNAHKITCTLFTDTIYKLYYEVSRQVKAGDLRAFYISYNFPTYFLCGMRLNL